MLRWIQKFFRLESGRSLDAMAEDADGNKAHPGCNEEWWIECEGQRLALLSDPRFEEMFWTSYAITLVTEDPVWRERLASDDFWAECESHDVIFRQRATDKIASYAFPALTPFRAPGRMLMRGLYL